MGAPALRVAVEGITVRRNFAAEYPEFLSLNERARKVARRNARAFPAQLRLWYWRGFVAGVTGADCLDLDVTPDQDVAYICGGIDGSAWA